KGGKPEEGLQVLSEALTVLNTTEQRHWEAELYRLQGTLTLQREAGGWRLETSSPSPQASSLQPPVSSGVEQEAEGYFRKAIDIARQQQAKSLELRAVMSLVRLRQQQALEHGAGSAEPGAKNETAGKREPVKARRPELRPSLPASQHSGV